MAYKMKQNYFTNLAGVSPLKQTKEQDPPEEKKDDSEWSWSDIGHATLDAVGLIPGLGEIADGANAAWYSAEGDYENAALSTAAMVPFVGWGATAVKGAKYAKKAKKTFDAAQSASENIIKTSKLNKVAKLGPHYGDIETIVKNGKRVLTESGSKKLDEILQATKARGKAWDNAKNLKINKENIKVLGEESGRVIIEVSPPGLPPQKFYKSTGGGKKFYDDGTSSAGSWLPFEGFGKVAGSDNYFLKNAGWKNSYGSKAFFNLKNPGGVFDQLLNIKK